MRFTLSCFCLQRRGVGGAKQGEAVKQTEKQTSKFPTKTTVDVCQGEQHLAAQARDHHTKKQRYKEIGYQKKKIYLGNKPSLV